MRISVHLGLFFAAVCWGAAGDSACGVEIQWDGSGSPPFGTNSESWQNVDNWAPVGNIVQIHRVPTDVDTATISVADDVVKLFDDTAPIDGLTINNGADLFTNGHKLTISESASGSSTGFAAVAGDGSRLWVEPTGGGSNETFATETLLLSGGGGLVMDGGDAFILGNAAMFSGSSILTPVPAPTSGMLNFARDLTMVDSTVDLDGVPLFFLGEGSEILLDDQSSLTLSNSLILDSRHTLTSMGSEIQSPGGTVSSRSSLQLLNDANGVSSRWEADGPVTIDNGSLEIGVFPNRLTGFTKLDVLNGGSLTSEWGLQLIDAGTATIASGSQVSIAMEIALLNDGLDTETKMIVRDTGTVVNAQSARIGSDSFSAPVEFLVSDNALVNLDFLTIGDQGFSNWNGLMEISDGGEVRVDATVRVNAPGVATAAGRSMLFVRNGGSFLQTGASSTQIGSTNPDLEAIVAIGRGGRYTSNDQDFLIENSGEVVVTGGAEAGVLTIGGPLEVKGQFVVGFELTNDAAAGIAHLEAPTVVDGGSITLDGGLLTADSITFANAGTFNFDSGKFSATNFNDDLVNNGGIVAPGTTAAGDGPGNMAIVGDYTATAGSALEIEIGGTTIISEHDFLDVANNLSLDGDLSLSLINGFVPAASDSFIVVSAGNLLGLFDNVLPNTRLDTIDGSGSFQVNYGVSSAFDPDQIVLSDFQVTTDADLDNDGDVDGTDFLLIQRTNPALIPLWQSQYGSGSLAGIVVPESVSIWLLAPWGIAFAIRRRTR